jgi:hypothetical protein
MKKEQFEQKLIETIGSEQFQKTKSIIDTISAEKYDWYLSVVGYRPDQPKTKSSNVRNDMKDICSFCKHQKSRLGNMMNERELFCDLQYDWTDPEGYGTFKKGSACIHDTFVKDRFQPKV